MCLDCLLQHGEFKWLPEYGIGSVLNELLHIRSQHIASNAYIT
jgi:hypothetical protein